MGTKKGEKNLGFDAPEEVYEQFMSSIPVGWKKKHLLTALCRYWLSLADSERFSFFSTYSSDAAIQTNEQAEAEAAQAVLNAAVQKTKARQRKSQKHKA